MNDKIRIKTDPHVRIGILREAEDKLLSDLKKEEIRIKQLLAEINVIRNQIEEAGNEIEQEELTTLVSERKKETKEFQELENIISESEKTRVSEITSLDAIKNEGLNNYQLQVATRTDSIKQLYELAYKPIWSQEDSQKFFLIQESTRKANAYELSNPIQQNVSDTYKALQFVEEQQKKQIETLYDPSKTFRDAANPIKKQADLHTLMGNYKT